MLHVFVAFEDVLVNLQHLLVSLVLVCLVKDTQYFRQPVVNMTV